MTIPTSTKFNTARLNNIYNNTVATYKFYWFLSILNLVSKGKTELSFNEIIAYMIAESWYPIHYFKISFGKSDSLYINSHELQVYLDISIDEEKNKIAKKIINNIENKEVIKHIKKFSQYVPYRFLSPWINSANNTEVEHLSRIFHNGCPYAIIKDKITINPLWIDYLKENFTILAEYTYWNLTLFLQKRNPNIPDLPSKLIKPIARESLKSQHNLWDQYIEQKHGIHCIYTGKLLNKENYDLDHFIPWSFVSHNLIWNLIPTDSSINSSKSNNLPQLNLYLKPMAQLQHDALKILYPQNPNNKLFEDYLTIYDSVSELVSMKDEQFLEIYQKTFSPIVQIAENTGFTYWTYPKL